MVRSNYGEYAINKPGVEALNLATDSVIVDAGCGKERLYDMRPQGLQEVNRILKTNGHFAIVKDGG